MRKKLWNYTMNIVFMVLIAYLLEWIILYPFKQYIDFDNIIKVLYELNDLIIDICGLILIYIIVSVTDDLINKE